MNMENKKGKQNNGKMTYKKEKTHFYIVWKAYSKFPSVTNSVTYL